jgi:hypothetical protein
MSTNTTYPTGEIRKRTQPVRWWHEIIVDDMLQYPRALLRERAARLKYSPEYLSLVMNTDMFKALYEERRAAFNARLDASIQQKAGQAANLALDLVIDSLEKKRDKIPFAELSEFTDRTLERLGYGVKPSTNVNVGVQLVAPPITKEELAKARGDLRAVEDSRQRVIEAIPLPAKPSEEGS